MSSPYVPNGFAAKLLTTDESDFSRLKTEQSRTGLYAGKQFRMIRKITSPITFKFISPVPFILLSQNITISDGDLEYYAHRSSNITETVAFTTPVLVIRKNAVNTSYTMQATIFSGGTITVTDAEQYVDYVQLNTANATAQRETLSAPSGSERILPAGSYYLNFTGAAEGSFSLEWEELA
jgi:hypothetical protein